MHVQQVGYNNIILLIELDSRGSCVGLFYDLLTR